MTWFRKEPGLVWLTIGEQEAFENVTGRILELVHRFLAGLAGASQREAQQTTVVT
ncbi:MAG: hypothetical protein ACKOCD_08960 [Nitrospiraceae bacterium]